MSHQAINSKTGFGYAINIYVGPSKSQSKEIQLPYDNMMVEPIPQNPLKSRWQDNTSTFEVEVEGKKLYIRREDANKGWGMELLLRGYYKQEAMATYNKEFNASIQGDESQTVTIRLDPNQTLRCDPKALIYKGESVNMTTASIGTVAKSTVPGMLKGGLKYIDTGIRGTTRSDDGNNSRTTAVSEYTYLGELGTSGTVTLGGKFPSKVLHLALGEFGNRIFFRQGAFLASSTDVEIVDSDFLDSFQSLVGHGEVFLKTGQHLKKIVLKEEETMGVKEDCLVAFTQNVQSNLEKRSKKLYGVLNKKVAVRELTGSGIVWMELQPKNFLENDDGSVDSELSMSGSTSDLQQGRSEDDV